MRTIRFRGKRVGVGKYIYGNLLYDKDMRLYISTSQRQGFNIDDNNCEIYEVDSETVGQFTGLHDKNGNDIYEGDIVCFQYTKNMKSEIAKEMGSYDDYLLLTEEQIYKLFPKHFTTYIVMWDKYDAIFGYTPLKGFGKYSRVESQMGETKRAFVIGNIHDNYDLINKNGLV